jgi:hypothetical protein
MLGPAFSATVFCSRVLSVSDLLQPTANKASPIIAKRTSPSAPTQLQASFSCFRNVRNGSLANLFPELSYSLFPSIIWRELTRSFTLSICRGRAVRSIDANMEMIYRDHVAFRGQFSKLPPRWHPLRLVAEEGRRGCWRYLRGRPAGGGVGRCRASPRIRWRSVNHYMPPSADGGPKP